MGLLALGAAGLLGARAANAGEAPPACSTDASYAQQDFTLGEWDVFNKGKKSAEVKMEKVLNGCAIRETWKSMGATGHGMGLFTYSRALKQWKYYWVADTAATTDFNGDMKAANDFLYVTEVPLAQGGKRVRHWTLTMQPDGTIRELSVGSNDGQNWNTEYELVWHRKH